MLSQTHSQTRSTPSAVICSLLHLIFSSRSPHVYQQKHRPGLLDCRQATDLAEQACAYIWYTPIKPANLTEAQRYIDDLPSIKVPYLNEAVSASCVRVVPSAGDARGALLLRLTDADIRSHDSACLKLEAVAKLLLERGHQVLLASSPGLDLNITLTFFISRPDEERILVRQPPRVFARTLLNRSVGAHGPELLDAWYTTLDKGDHGRHVLMGNVVVATPADAKYLVDHGEFTAVDPDDEGYSLRHYLITFERPRGFLQPAGMNELVIPVKAGEAFDPAKIVKQLKDAIKRRDGACFLGPKPIDTPEKVTIWGTEFARFHCSRPGLADKLSTIRCAGGFTPAFTFHTNAHEERWKLKAMREYSTDQERERERDRREAHREVQATALRYVPKPITNKQQMARLRLQISGLEKVISQSRMSPDGQLDTHLRKLAELQEKYDEIRKLEPAGQMSGSLRVVSGLPRGQLHQASQQTYTGNAAVGPPRPLIGDLPMSRDPRLRRLASQSPSSITGYQGDVPSDAKQTQSRLRP